MYKYYLFDVPTMDDALDQINGAGEEIISCFYTADTFQVCIITRAKKELPNIRDILLRKEAYAE